MHQFFYIATFFLIYSFLGWALEVVFHAVVQGKVINRGFLNGPICPIYGFGMVSVIMILSPLADNLLLLSAGGIFLATFIELVGGYVLLKMFHMRWWDYTNEPFNLGGFICVRFSLAWGICIVFAIKIIHPAIYSLVKILDRIPGYALDGILYLILIADVIITVLTVANLNKDLAKLYALGSEIRSVSDTITDAIGNTTIDANVVIQKQRVQLALGKAELRDKKDETLVAIRDKKDETIETIGEIRDKAGETLGTVKDKAGETIVAVKDKAGETFVAVKDKAGDTLENVKGKAGDTIGTVKDKAGDTLGGVKEKAEGAVETIREKADDTIDSLKTKAEELKNKYEEVRNHLSAKTNIGYRRIYKAYPNLKHMDYNEELESIINKEEEV